MNSHVLYQHISSINTQLHDATKEPMKTNESTSMPNDGNKG